MKRKNIGLLLALAMLLSALAGCAAAEIVTIEDGDSPMGEMPVSSALPMPKAAGSAVKSNSKAAIDHSNTADGYVMIKYTAQTKARLKVQLTGPSKVTYTYDLNNKGEYETFPLSDGSGEYKIGVFENISGIKYATALSHTIKATLKDEFAPFLLPNQYVNYTEKSEAVKKAAELTQGLEGTLDKVGAIYKFVVEGFTYDTELAKTVKSGYLPEVDKVLEKKKGICFDYAAVMTAMLRSQGVPTKLVIGYAGDVYHAWLNTYVEEIGWVEGVIRFDGKEWKLMDPTFASSSKNSQSVLEFIGNGKNYSAKYLY